MNLAYALWRGEFAKAMDDRFYDLDYLDGLIEARRAHLITADDAAVIFEFKLFPTGNTALHFLVAAGNIETIIGTLRPEAERIGRDLGCIAAIVDSRGGWARALREYGYSPFQTAIAKEL
jgi:hypothetical protein